MVPTNITRRNQPFQFMLLTVLLLLPATWALVDPGDYVDVKLSLFLLNLELVSVESPAYFDVDFVLDGKYTNGTTWYVFRAHQCFGGNSSKGGVSLAFI